MRQHARNASVRRLCVLHADQRSEGAYSGTAPYAHGARRAPPSDQSARTNASTQPRGCGTPLARASDRGGQRTSSAPSHKAHSGIAETPPGREATTRRSQATTSGRMAGVKRRNPADRATAVRATHPGPSLDLGCEAGGFDYNRHANLADHQAFVRVSADTTSSQPRTGRGPL